MHPGRVKKQTYLENTKNRRKILRFFAEKVYE
jgi:hypothetical protein